MERDSDLEVRPVEAEDREWIEKVVEEYWGSSIVVSRGRVHEPTGLQGFVAFKNGFRCGLATYEAVDGVCELVTLNTVLEGEGVGTALVAAVMDAARRAGCSRLWLITTNDNTDGLRFYQKKGFRLTAVHRDAIEASRKLKPEMPDRGRDGIPIRDEIELEMAL